MSPTDDLFSTGYPGGIYNNGFAAEWINSRISDAKAAAILHGRSAGPEFDDAGLRCRTTLDLLRDRRELAASNGASSTCLANQALHNQSEDLAGLIGPQLVAPGTGSGRDPALFDRRSMVDVGRARERPGLPLRRTPGRADRTSVAGADRRLPKTTPLFANMVNGGHIDSTDPQTISRWLEFLDIYVADKVPTQPNSLEALVLDLLGLHRRLGVSAQSPLPALRFTDRPDVAAGRSEFAGADPAGAGPLRQRCRSAGPGNIGVHLQPRISPAGPRPARSTTLYLGRWLPRSGAAATVQAAPLHAGPVGPALDQPPGGRERLGGQSGLGLDAGPGIRRHRVPDRPVHHSDDRGRPGHARPLGQGVGAGRGLPGHDHRGATSDGPGGVRDVGVLAQHEPGRQARFHRALHGPDLSSQRTPAISRRTAYSLVKIPIDPIVHTFRPGTELRVVISAPGGDRPVWTFAHAWTTARGLRSDRTVGALSPGRQRGAGRHRHPGGCRLAARCAGSPAGPTRPRATSRRAEPDRRCGDHVVRRRSSEYSERSSQTIQSSRVKTSGAAGTGR